jgi:hypothetical protein
MLKFLALLLLLLAAFVNSTGNIAGGWTKVDKNNPTAISAAKFAAQHTIGNKKYTVASVSKQVSYDKLL